MSAYAIFAVVLTIAYIIYYGYNISKDVYGKKGETDDKVETIDVDLGEEEVVAVSVKESGDGFSLDDSTYEPLPSPDEEESGQEDPASTALKQKYNNIYEGLETAEVCSNESINNVELHEMMLDTSVGKSRKIQIYRENV